MHRRTQCGWLLSRRKAALLVPKMWVASVLCVVFIACSSSGKKAPVPPSEDSTPTKDTSSETTAPTDTPTQNADVFADTQVIDTIAVPDLLPAECDNDLDGFKAIQCAGTDCDDNNVDVHPDATEICGNTVDEDCSGTLDDLDVDQDGVVGVACGGTDCNDHSAWTNPLAVDSVSGYCTAPQLWTKTVAFSAEHKINWPRFSIDKDGIKHLIHYNNDTDVLFYSTDSTGDWTTSPMGNVGYGGSNASLQIAPDGSVHATFLDFQNGWLRYVTNADGEWKFGVVDDSKFVGWFSTLIVGDDGARYVVYRSAIDTSVRIATCQKNCTTNDNGISGWSHYTVDQEGDVGKFATLRQTQDALFRVAYQDLTGQRLQLATAAAAQGPWTLETVDSSVGTGWSIDMAEGRDNVLHVSFINPETGHLMLASKVNGSWNSQQVTDLVYDEYAGQTASLVINPDGLPSIAYPQNHGAALYLARCTSLCGGQCCENAWETDLVNPIEGSATYAQMQLDADGHLIIAHRNTTELILMTAACPESGADNNCDGVDGVDQDGDLFASTDTGGLDCDDKNAKINPNADDIPNDGLDANCDGLDCGDLCSVPCSSPCDCMDDAVPAPPACDSECTDCEPFWSCISGFCSPSCGVIPAEVQACIQCPEIICQSESYVPIDTDDDGCNDLCVLNTGCGGKCGQELPKGLCQCHEGCVKEGTCCEDFCAVCGDVIASACCTPSCDGKAPGSSDDCGGICDGPPTDGSCWKLCGVFDGTKSCQCNPECMEDQTCCDDFCDLCEDTYPTACCLPQCDGKSMGSPDECGGYCATNSSATPLSCKGSCGVFDAESACQCDQNCLQEKSCCADFCESCPGIASEDCCIPNCKSSASGLPDGCGGICGGCTPMCEGKAPGSDDGCGNPCDACEPGTDPNCCVPQCDNKAPGEADGCDGVCAPCDPLTDPLCCLPDCTGKSDGSPDGCGGVCATCDPSTDPNCCLPDCSNKKPNDPDGCGGVCVACDPATDPNCCVPDCEGKPKGAPSGCGSPCLFDNLPDPSNNIENAGSCAGKCGQLDMNAPCQCDELCFIGGDCCVDVCNECHAQFPNQCKAMCFCPAKQVWDGQSCCTPNCSNNTCGNEDGCGGLCQCDSENVCVNGQCQSPPTTCAPVMTVECGQTLSNLHNHGIWAQKTFAQYGCNAVASTDFDNGMELLLAFESNTKQEVRIDSNNSQWMETLVLPATPGSCADAAAGCLAWGPGHAEFTAEPNTPYWIVWDTWTTNPSPLFDVTVTCCTPSCDGKACGPDGCGGECGGCAPGEACMLGSCCKPSCSNTPCGASDGCGGQCTCPMDKACVNHQCVPAPALCAAVTTVQCGETLTALNNVGANASAAFDTYSCKNTMQGVQFDQSNEIAYRFVADADTTVTAHATNNGNMFLMVLNDDGNGCVDTGNNCIAQDPNHVTFDATTGDTYYLILDGTDDSVMHNMDVAVSCCKKSCAPGTCGMDNGCNGICSCPPGQTCLSGTCCTPDCNTGNCDDGCGGFCGASPACGDIGPQGACVNGQLLHCYDGQLHQINCGLANSMCGFNSQTKSYDCLQ